MIEILRWLAILVGAALRERGDLVLENLALRQQLGVLRRKKESRDSTVKTACFGWCSRESGPIGERPCTWSRRTRWSDGSAKASGSIGPGFRGGEVPADR